MSEPAIVVENINVSYRGNRVLEDINLTLQQGDFVGLIGPNGAGKTVLLRVLLGLVRAESGRVEVFGKPPRESRRRMGYVPQYANFNADFPISVFDATLMGRLTGTRFCRRYSNEDKEATIAILERLKLKELAQRQLGKLSGGQVQRVLIARALVSNPELLLLDEPTASLDTKVGADIYEILAELSERLTIVLVSHDIGVIADHVKTIACLNRTLHYHNTKELSGKMLEDVYGCPVDIIAHGHAHRVLPRHDGEEES